MSRYSVIIILAIMVVLLGSVLGAPSIKVAPDIIDDPDILYTITWAGVTKLQPDDALVVYLVPRDSKVFPVPAGPSRKQIGFFHISEHQGSQPGSGSVQIPVYLPRDMAFYFELTRPENKAVTVLASSGLLLQKQHYFCSHFHLATTHKNGEMLVQYVTSDPAKTSHWVQVSTDSKFETNVALFNATDNNLHYTVTDFFEAPANKTQNFIDPGRFREGLLSGLSPNTEYFYRVVKQAALTPDLVVISKDKSFISAPIPGTAETDLYIFGDLGVGLGMYSTLQQQATSLKTTSSIYQQLSEQAELNKLLPNGHKRHSALLLMGDLSYARGYSWLWEIWFKQVEPLSSQIPFHISIGNHEYDYLKQTWKPDWSDFAKDSGGEGGIATMRRFKCPDDFHATPYTKDSWYSDAVTKDYTARKERNIAYSYDTGYIHVIVFSAEHDFTKGSAQFNFIKKDLQNVDRSVTPWVIITAHRPMYCTASNCSIAPGVESKMMDWHLRQHLEDLIVEHRVHLFVAGHNHHYARSSMITKQYQFVASPDVYQIKDGIAHIKYRAPIHIVTGAAGNEYEGLWRPYLPMVKDNVPVLHHAAPDWLEFRTMSFGYSRIVANATHLTQTFYGNQRTGLIHDKFVLSEP